MMKAKDVAAGLEDVRLGDDNIHGSLPSADEVKTTHILQRSRGCTKKIFLICLTVALFLIIACTILGVSVQNRRDEDEMEAEMDHLQEVMDFVSQYSDQDNLDDSSSAQFKAARWMALEDSKSLPLQGPRFLQRYALMTLYFATGGEHWLYDLNFASPNRDECHWNHEFRQPHGSSYELGVNCGNDNQVTSLSIDAMGLTGTLPTELSLLTHMQHLSLRSNSLSGDIPNLHTMTQLTSLTLTYNNYSTKLPTWLGKLSNLSFLGLTNNNFRSTIPTDLLKLTSLESLALDDNSLTGSLDSIEKMNWLKNIYLHGNQFTGTLNNDFLSDLNKLEVLNLSNNLLKGGVPRDLMHHTTLKILVLNDNKLNGGLPNSIPHSTSLQVLAIQNNMLTGSIPPSIENLVSLQRLDVSLNNLDGTIPTALGTLAKMTSLSLSSNNFVASAIPPFLITMPLLQEISLKATRRIGKIPPWLGTDFNHLVMLDLDDNSLSGSIPTHIASLGKLEYMFLSRNDLIGELPSEMSTMSNLSK
jgi:Leucine-rich repeat (LRR) protein